MNHKDQRELYQYRHSVKRIKKIKNMLEELLNQFYLEYEDSYIDANTHGVIKLLVEEMQEEGLLPEEEIDWDNLG